MPSILDACDRYFGTRDVYGLFKLEKECQEKESEYGYREFPSFVQIQGTLPRFV